MLTPTLLEALNDQIQKEFSSGYVYLAVAAHFESTGLPGFAHWMRVQSQEEFGHGLKLFDYVLDRGARVTLKAIDAPPTDLGQPVVVMTMTLAHERRVTDSIHALHQLAAREVDLPTQVALQWFINEQVEEEKSAALIVDQLKLIGSDGSGLLALDRQLAARGAG